MPTSLTIPPLRAVVCNTSTRQPGLDLLINLQTSPGLQFCTILQNSVSAVMPSKTPRRAKEGVSKKKAKGVAARLLQSPNAESMIANAATESTGTHPTMAALLPAKAVTKVTVSAKTRRTAKSSAAAAVPLVSTAIAKIQTPPDDSNVTIDQRARGAIFGVCIGDALGGPIQFKDRFTPITINEKLRKVGTFSLPEGSFSDDGSMTLALAHSFIDQGGAFNKKDVVLKFLGWFDRGEYSCARTAFDLGGSTRIALGRWGSE
jgi:hypothetical protein